MNEQWKAVEMKLLERRSLDADTACWMWTGACDDEGYGRIFVSTASPALKAYRTHRAAAVLWLGMPFDWPRPVMHRCDRRPCFNPEHLKVATQSENLWDMRLKKRWGVQPGEVDKGRQRYRQVALRQLRDAITEARTAEERAEIRAALDEALRTLNQ